MDIYHDSNSIVNIDYCLSNQEQLPGNHNLLADPLFIDAYNYNFNLQENSPCINAGNPDLPLDPDYTISDIGAYYYNTDTTGLFEQNNLTQSVYIFPNPATNNFTIELDKNKNTIIQLFNINGQLVLEEQYHKIDKQNIDISYLPAGLYVVKITSNLLQSTTKLVIQ